MNAGNVTGMQTASFLLPGAPCVMAAGEPSLLLEVFISHCSFLQRDWKGFLSEAVTVGF